MRSIIILNAVTLDAEGDIETPLTLDVGQKAALEFAAARGLPVILYAQLSGEVGSVNAAINTLSGSIDGTNFFTVFNNTDISLNANGVSAEAMTIANAPLLFADLAKLRLDATVVQLDGSHNIVATIALLIPGA